jgi:signal transduction histidine kinase
VAQLRNQWLVDGAVASVFVVAGQLTAWGAIQDSNVPLHGSRVLQSVLFFAVTGLVVLRRRAPLVALGAMLPLGVLQTATGGTSSFFSGFLPVVIVLFGAASRSSARVAVAAGLWALVGLIAIVAVSEDLHFSNEVPFASVLLAATVAIGQLVHRRSLQAAGALERLDQAEEEKRRVVAEERARIARELHDVVAHSLSVITVQSGVARVALGVDRAQAEQSLLVVERAGRQALDEMRRLLGVLRQDAGGEGLTPQPGLSDIEALVEHVRQAETKVVFTTDGVPNADVAPGVQLSAYRVVQEALTNAIKHGTGGRADVHVRYQPNAIDIEVVNPLRADGPTGNGGGHGLVGMRERVELYGGRLDAGARSDTFRVHASIPTGRA